MRRMPVLTFSLAIPLLLLLCPTAGFAAMPEARTSPRQPRAEVRDLSSHFHGLKGAFVLYDTTRHLYLRHNVKQCRTRFTPASTFKILNSLIGLETGVIPDENYVIRWDSVKRDMPAWNRDHTLHSAIQNSVVWYYQELARRVGYDRMKTCVERVRYGNTDISGGIDHFWLGSSLKISADEQIEFLKKLCDGSLPFSQRSITIVKDITVLEHTDTYTLHGKTGFSTDSGGLIVGWFVGFVERGDDVYVFAANIISRNRQRDMDRILAGRKDFTLNILKGLKVL